MECAPGDLVTVADGSLRLDGLVFETPSSSKVVLAVVDPKRGPQFRSVNPSTVSERSAEGPHDHALRLLVKRTVPATHSSTRGARGNEHGRTGFMRGTAHRPTGR
jgi:hypothetical protein